MVSNSVAYDVPNMQWPKGTNVGSIEYTEEQSTQREMRQSTLPAWRSAGNEISAARSLEPIRILIAERHPVFREGLSAIISAHADMRLAAQAVNAEEVLVQFRRYRPDVTLMDLSLSGTDSVEALVSIRREFPDARVIMLSASDGDAEIQRALRAGAAGFAFKSIAKNELVGVIRSVHAGKRHVPAEVAARLAEHLSDDDLTARELDVLRFIRDGFANKQIAHQLAIAETTVNFHIKNLVDKLRANSRTHAVTIAFRRGLLHV
jgi:DNA-binding NarL/FixJ family response regulator